MAIVAEVDNIFIFTESGETIKKCRCLLDIDGNTEIREIKNIESSRIK